MRPGLVLLNSTRVNEKNCPEIFKNWDKIWFTDVAPMTEGEINYQKNYRDKITLQLKDFRISKLIYKPWDLPG